MFQNVNSYQNFMDNNLYSINRVRNKTNFSSTNRISSLISTANSPNKLNTYSLYTKNNAEFINQYSSSLASLKETASKLSSNSRNSVLNNLSVSTSNKGVLSASSFFKSKEKSSYLVNVTQIANKQINVSRQFNSNDVSTMGMSNLNIGIKNRNYSFNVDTEGKTNKQSLTEFADKINKSNIGVSATVEEADEKSILKLTSDTTGQNEQFEVSGSEEFMNQSNLNDVRQVAQNAIYSVSKNGIPTFTDRLSSSNDVDIDGYKVSATLKNEGQAAINVDVDKEAVMDAVEDFVFAYNDTMKFLNENFNKGSGISKQIDNLEISQFQEKNLNELGISKNSNDLLTLDKEVLSDAMENENFSVESLFAAYGNVFSEVERSSISSMRESSINLVDNSLDSIFSSNSLYNNNDSFNTFGFLSIYNRFGNYSTINPSTIGLFLNSFV